MRRKPAVIIPLDGSETATVALGAAQAMTKKMGAVLHIVHVTEELLSEEQLLKRLKVGSIEVRDFSLHQLIGNAVDQILKFAASVETEMIVMSSHGWTFNPQRLMGGITMGIIEHAVNPVMLIRPDMETIPGIEWEPKKMLVPQNGTPTAAAGMDRIFRMAKMIDTDVDVLNIGVVGEKPTEAGTIVPSRYMDYPRYDWPGWATEFIERFYADHPPEVKLSLFEREGDPVEVMIGFAAENDDDMIVLSWHGHLEKGRAAVIKGVLRKTELPIVLVRTE